MTQLKSLAHPEWPYTGTPWAWRGFAEKQEPQEPSMSKKDFEQARAVYQKQNFGPCLP